MKKTDFIVTRCLSVKSYSLLPLSVPPKQINIEQLSPLRLIESEQGSPTPIKTQENPSPFI